MSKTLVEEYVENPIHMRLFQQERAVYEVTELIESVLREQGVTRSQLAAKLGKSKAWITQLLDGERNKTIRTIADVFAVLGREYRSTQKPIQIQSEVSATSTKIEQCESHGGLRILPDDGGYQTKLWANANSIRPRHNLTASSSPPTTIEIKSMAM